MVINTEKKHDQQKTRGKVLIVDDEPAIRNILIFTVFATS